MLSVIGVELRYRKRESDAKLISGLGERYESLGIPIAGRGYRPVATEGV
jgi:hypothetical protein